MKVVKIILGVMFGLTSIIGFTSSNENPNNLLGGVIAVIIAVLLLISAFKAPKKKYPYFHDREIVLKSGQHISIDDIFRKFGNDRTGLREYLMNTYHLKSSVAQWIILSIYRDYYQSFLNWSSTRKVNAFMEIDDASRRIGIVSPYTKPKWQITDVFGFDEILSYELYDNGTVVTSGGLGSAIVGGALFGGAGAVVGSNVGKKTSKVNDYSVKITLQNPGAKPIFVKGIKARQAGEEILSALDQIVNQNKAVSNQYNASPADEIRKYKELLDDGILTQEEFDAKKKELLGR